MTATRQDTRDARAQAVLAENNLSPAWDIYQGLSEERDETTVRDIVDRLVRYGSLSPKQVSFLASLLNRIAERPAREAARAAEAALAADCPTGRMEVEGELLTVRVEDTPYGVATKMLVKHSSGWRVWGTMPALLKDERAAKGDTVRFTATIQPSERDAKFGFLNRPMGGAIVRRAAESA